MGKLIVGLGNPGSAYTSTRHNIGRRVVETLAHEFRLSLRSSKSLRTHLAEGDQEGHSFILAYLDSYMNESGGRVKLLVDHFGIHFKTDLLIVVDDAALPFGRLRLRSSGQDGGHKGLRSIEAALGTKAYARLRVGIAPINPIEESLEKYVLSPFTRNEEKELDAILNRTAQTCRFWIIQPLQRVMDFANRSV